MLPGWVSGWMKLIGELVCQETSGVLFSQIFIFHNVTITVPQTFTQCTTRGSFQRHWQETLYNMFTFTCLFLLPLVIMIFCYTRILVEISKGMRKGNGMLIHRSSEHPVAIKSCLVCMLTG